MKIHRKENILQRDGDKNMSNYAYRDRDRKDIIYSNQAIKEDRNTAFFAHIPCVMRNYLSVQLMEVEVHILAQLNRILNISRIVHWGIAVLNLIKINSMNQNSFMMMQ